MPLSSRQITVLRYLGDRKTATTRKTAKDLHMGRDSAQNALRLLADKGLVSADHGTVPVSWSVTEIGSAVLAAATEWEPS